MYQSELKNGTVVTRAEANIHYITCDGSGENGRQVLVYEYPKEPGVFKGVQFGYWDSPPLGGRAYPSLEEAATVSCAMGTVFPGP